MSRVLERELSELGLVPLVAAPPLSATRREWQGKHHLAQGLCECPIRLARTTRGSLHSEKVLVRCNSRRSDRCSYCSTQYAKDVVSVLRAGIDRRQPITFLTATAPSMVAAGYERCLHHLPNDDHAGSPLDDYKFDYDEAARWNSVMPALWKDTLRRLRNELERNNLSTKLRYFRVVEPQRRGLGHIHVVFAGVIDKEILAEAFNTAQAVDAMGQVHQWGSGSNGLDVSHVFPDHKIKQKDSKEWKIINYLVKYLTKSLSHNLPESRKLQAHHERLRAEALALAEFRYPLCSYANEAGAAFCTCSVCHQARLARRRAVEGFGNSGHVWSKSHSWGRTLRECREARRAYGLKHSANPESPSNYDWEYVGSGYPDGMTVAAFLTWISSPQLN